MKTKISRLLLLVVIVTGITLVVIYREAFDAAALAHWVQSAGAAGPVVFMLLYAVGSVLFLPGSVLTLAGGALFGPVLGTFYNLTGATLGATLAFLVARYLASDWVEQQAGGRIKQLKHGVETEGWRFVAFTRLVPLFPFNLLNYALGLTRIRFAHYLIATYVCMLPGAIAYTYLGYAGREALAGSEGLIQKALLALALLAAVAFLPGLIGRLRRKPMLSVAELKQRLDKNADLMLLDVRTAADYVGEPGHIAGSVNIPLEDLNTRLNELSDRLERPIAIVCRTDRRSTKAGQILVRQGYAEVQVVQNGMTAWNEAGYAVEQ